jgi:hypothetical protein
LAGVVRLDFVPRESQLAPNDRRRRKDHLMLDIAMVAIALVFFALSVGYAVACDRL